VTRALSFLSDRQVGHYPVGNSVLLRFVGILVFGFVRVLDFSFVGILCLGFVRMLCLGFIGILALRLVRVVRLSFLRGLAL